MSGHPPPTSASPLSAGSDVRREEVGEHRRVVVGHRVELGEHHGAAGVVPVARVVAADLAVRRVPEVVLVERVVADERQVSALVAVAGGRGLVGDGPHCVERVAERDVVQVRVVVRVVRRRGVVDLVVAPRRAVGVERVGPVLAGRGADAGAPVLAGVLVEVLALVGVARLVADERRARVAPVRPELARLLDRVGVVDLGVGAEVVLDVGLESPEDVAPLAVPPRAVGFVEFGVAVVAVVVDVGARDAAAGGRVEAVDRALVEADRHRAAVPDPHAPEVGLAEIGLDRDVVEVFEIPDRLVARHVHHAVVDVALVGEEILPVRVLGGVERPGLVRLHVPPAGRTARTVVFVEREDVDVLGG